MNDFKENAGVSNPPDRADSGGERLPTAPLPAKTADRPHPITIAIGLMSPLLALISLGVSFYVFWNSQKSVQVAQRAYLVFHFESAQVTPERRADGSTRFRVGANVSVRDVGNTPAYIDTVKKEVYAIDGDNMWDHIGGSSETSPNYDALGPKGEPAALAYNSEFTGRDFTGDRSVVYRIEIRWHDAFGEAQPPTVYCTILSDVSPSITEQRSLSAEPCIHGMTFSIGSAR